MHHEQTVGAIFFVPYHRVLGVEPRVEDHESPLILEYHRLTSWVVCWLPTTDYLTTRGADVKKILDSRLA